jgi:catechol 1,2-dioxygenase
MTQSLDRRSVLKSFGGVVGVLFGGRALGSTEPTCSATGSDIRGPFYIAGAPRRPMLAGPQEKGERIRIQGSVFAADCTTPLAGALLDIWHADADGNYHDAKEQYRLRGQILTDARGRYEFETIRPGNYRQEEGWRPAHIHLTVSAPAHQSVTTQLYFRGDPYLAPHDSCGDECHSDDPHRIIALERDGVRLTGRFDLVLKPQRG